MPSHPGTLIAKSRKVISTMKEAYCDGGFASIFPILQQQRLHHLLLGHDLQRKDEHKVGLENSAVKSSVQGHCDANIQRQRHSQRKDFNTLCVLEETPQLPAYLAKGALHATKEVVVTGPDAVSAMDVIDFKSQLLDLLKIVVQWENLGKDWVQVALDHLCPVQLRGNK